jgi:urease beta subunit
MDTLSGRLGISPMRIPSSNSVQVTIELTNRGQAAVQVPSGNPFSFRAIVRDGHGATVAPTLQRVDVLSATTWLRVEPGQSSRVSTTLQPEAGYQLDTTTQVWRLPAGKYEVSGRFIVDADDAPRDAWVGALDLAPVAVEILP